MAALTAAAGKTSRSSSSSPCFGISSSLNSYNAHAASSETYEALKECMPDPPEVVNLDVAAWLTTGDFSMDSTDTTLSGSLPLEGDTFSWNLTAD